MLQLIIIARIAAVLSHQHHTDTMPIIALHYCCCIIIIIIRQQLTKQQKQLQVDGLADVV